MSARARDASAARVERMSGGLERPTLVVAGAVILGLIMAVLDTTIVNVALDTISRDVHAPLSTIQWISTGYLLSLAAVIPLSGWITERFGSKRTWIASIAVFAIGSGLCALETSLLVRVTGRTCLVGLPARTRKKLGVEVTPRRLAIRAASASCASTWLESRSENARFTSSPGVASASSQLPGSGTAGPRRSRGGSGARLRRRAALRVASRGR